MESILNSVKKMIGNSENDTSFDTDLIVHINSAFSILQQIGVGPAEGFSISGDTETWEDYLGDRKDLNMVKTYVFIKTRMVFDPPTSGIIKAAYDEQCKEIESRCSYVVDPGPKLVNRGDTP